MTTHPTLIPSLALLVLLGACAPAAPVAESTPVSVSTASSTPTDLGLPSKPYPLPTVPSSAPETATTDPAATDPGATAPNAPAATAAATRAAAPKTTAAAAPKTTAAAPAAPKTTAAATVWVAYPAGGGSCERNVQTGQYRGCTSSIRLTGCTYNASTGKTLGTWSYFGASASSAYTITINGVREGAVTVGQGPGVASAKEFGPGTSCSATIS